MKGSGNIARTKAGFGRAHARLKVNMIQRPVLTFSSEVSEWVRDIYAQSDVILEYGSGGSTVMAAEMPGKTIFSVESDKRWARNLNKYLVSNDLPSKVMMHYVDVGRTGKWGSPIDSKRFRRYHMYPLSIWDHPEFRQPDVVMIDGRFRVACALTTMFRCQKNTLILFDDYKNRRGYHMIDDYLEPKEIRGNTALFETGKTAISSNDLTKIIGTFSRHF
jgi:hypothetical protein